MKIKSEVHPLTYDYSSVTELPGSGATKEQLARLYHRYYTAAQYITHKRVLEVACGAGIGLGYLEQTAARVVGGDYTPNLLRVARSYYQGQIPLLALDAHHLPLRSQTFDVAIIFEAIYYLADAERFISEVRRVLAANGILLIGAVNKDWPEFAPSPFSSYYFSVPELCDLLSQSGFSRLECYGAFPTKAASFKHTAISFIRRLAVALNLMPKTLASRSHFKRLFYGKLSPLPSKVSDGMAALYPTDPIATNLPNKDYKIIYYVGHP